MTVRIRSLVPTPRTAMRRASSLAVVVCLLSSVAPTHAQHAGRTEGGGASTRSSAESGTNAAGADITIPERASTTDEPGEQRCDSVKAVYEEHKTSGALLDYALCEQAAGHHARVLALLTSSTDEPGATLTDEQRALVQRLQEVSRTQVTSLTIEVTVSGAEVWLDGRSVGKTPIAQPIVVDRGPHEVRAEKAGYRALEESCLVAGGTVSLLRLALKPLVGRAGLRVEATPKDAISVDGRPLGVGSWNGTIDAGTHRIGVVRADRSYQTDVTLSEDSLTTLVSPEPPSGAPPKGDEAELVPRWVYTVAGAALIAGVGVTAYLLTHRDPASPPPTAEPPVPLGWSF